MAKSGVPPDVLRCTVKSRAPGPVIVTSLVIESLSLVSVIAPVMEKLIVFPPLDALLSSIAWRSVPAPLSVVSVTVIVAAFEREMQNSAAQAALK
jgi:hypothetical protein